MNDDRFLSLMDGMLEERLSEFDRSELTRQLRESARARAVYWEFIEQDVLLQELVRESAGRDLAQLSFGAAVSEQFVRSETSTRRGLSAGRLRQFRLASLVVLVSLLLAGTVFLLRTQPVTETVPHDAVATLRSLMGNVWLVRNHGDMVKASSGQQFAAGDAVQVDDEGAADVVLTDGSRVVLSADSLLRFVPESGAQTGLHLERGGAEIDAAPQSPESPLIITTGQARLTVLGTRFRLYAAGDDSRVELEEGKVRFERQSDGQSVEVAAGEFAVATADADSPQPLIASPLQAAWRLRQTLLRAGSRVVFSHAGDQVATSGFPRLKVWDVATGGVQHEYKADVRFECLAFTAADEALVGLDHHGHAVSWTVGESKPSQAELKSATGKLRRCAVSRDGRWLAQTTSDDSGHLPVWQVDDAGMFSPLRSLPMKASSVTIAATGAGLQVVASAWDGTTVLWDAQTGRELARYNFPLQLHVIELSTDGRWLCGFGNQAGLVLVDTETGEQRNLWPAGSVHVNALRFSRDGRSLYAGMADGVVRAWSAADGKLLLVLATGDTRLTSLDISDDGRWLAVSGDADRVTIWQSDPR